MTSVKGLVACFFCGALWRCFAGGLTNVNRFAKSAKPGMGNFEMD